MGNISDMKPFSAVFPQMRFGFDDRLFSCLFLILSEKEMVSGLHYEHRTEGFYVLTLPQSLQAK